MTTLDDPNETTGTTPAGVDFLNRGFTLTSGGDGDDVDDVDDDDDDEDDDLDDDDEADDDGGDGASESNPA